VVVTGSSRGIGQGIAEMFGGEGSYVAGLDVRDGEETAGLAGERFRHFHCDLEQPQEIAEAFLQIDEHFGGPPDVLCAVAGIAPLVTFLDTDVETFDRIMAVNVRAVFVCGQEASRRMREAGGGRIVNIASTASVQAWDQQAAYGASKGAVALLTKCMAVELGQYGIAVNAVGPGSVVTPLSRQSLEDPVYAASELNRTAVGRLGTPADIAAAVRFLACDARWLTGQVIYVDGGFLATGYRPPGELGGDAGAGHGG
jgi:NAD(P)-dependent dehydrogenase (short-subunit alcohol dehydrogenase family)